MPKFNLPRNGKASVRLGVGSDFPDHDTADKLAARLASLGISSFHSSGINTGITFLCRRGVPTEASPGLSVYWNSVLLEWA